MKKFAFKLESLFEYRKRLEEISRKDFAEALKRLCEEDDKLSALRRLYARSSEEADSLKEESIHPEELGMYYSYIAAVKDRIAGQEAILKSVRTELEVKRAGLMKASTDKLLIGTMKDKSFAAYRETVEKEEQKTTDDMNSMRFKRGGHED
ncbi:MAG: flagellar export protein FliJ [Deltaproteobacteria bacterium]|nr:flagellar export protein FliJ [Deltaproteobacteria bacterium]